MMTELDYFSLTTVPVEPCANGKSLDKAATGFVWRAGSEHFLITNWHVVTGRDARTGELEVKASPDMLRCLFNLRDNDFGKQQRDISIRDEEHRPLWFVHPIHGPGVDVVAVPLPFSGEDMMINLRPINTYQSLNLRIKIGMDVFILGYPFGPEPPGYPVWKRGSIASEPDLVRLSSRYLSVDTASRPGMSGAPVIRRSWGKHLLEGGGGSSNDSAATKFVGVYSGRRHTKDKSDAQIGMVWPEYCIDEILTTRRRDE